MLVAVAKHRGHRLIFMDNFSRAAEIEDENGPEMGRAAEYLAERAKAAELAVLILHHNRKATGNVFDLSRGGDSARRRVRHQHRPAGGRGTRRPAPKANVARPSKGDELGQDSPAIRGRHCLHARRQRARRRRHGDSERGLDSNISRAGGRDDRQAVRRSPGRFHGHRRAAPGRSRQGRLGDGGETSWPFHRVDGRAAVMNRKQRSAAPQTPTYADLRSRVVKLNIWN